MTQQELNEYLKSNLKIDFSLIQESYRVYPCVTLLIGDEVISQSINYEMEIINN